MNNLARYILSFLFLPIILFVEVFRSKRGAGKKVLYFFIILFLFSVTWITGWRNIFAASDYALYELGITDRLKNVPIRGTSMLPTIKDGSTVTLKSPKKYGIDRGDIVTFQNIETGNLSYIKRVVGLPGETISIVNGIVLINNQALDEPYVYQENPTYGNSYLVDCEAYEIPKGKVAIMGDNRIVSMDSRIIGFVDKKDIDGVLKTDKKPEFTSITRHPKLQTTTTLNSSKVLEILNKKRETAKVNPLILNDSLSKVATSRATAASTNIETWKKNQTDLTTQLDQHGYTYLLVQEMTTFGYLTEEQLVDQVLESTFYRDEFLSGKYFDIGIGVSKAVRGQCSFPVITLIISMPTTPTYLEETLNSWSYDIEVLTRIITSLQALKFDARVSKDQTQELINEASSLLSTAQDIQSKVEQNQWLLSSESDELEKYSEKTGEVQAKIEAYYEQYAPILTDAKGSQLLAGLTTGRTEYNTQLEKVRLHFAKGEFQEQLKTSEELLVISKSPNEKAISYYWMGLAYYKLRNLPKAKENLNKALEINPEYSGPYVTLAAVAFDEERYQEGLTLAQKCVELDPEYAWCHNNLGLAYLYLDQKQKGITELQKAVDLDPTNYTFSDNLKRAKAE